MEHVHIDIGGARIEHRTLCIAIPQRRKFLTGCGNGDFHHSLLDGHQPLEGVFLGRGRKEQRFAGRQEAALPEMRTGCARQRQNGRGPVIWLIGRSGPAGGVIAGAVFHFANGDAVTLGQMGLPRKRRQCRRR